MKDKLTIQNQIKYLKNDKNIKFEFLSEQEAFLFLSNNNYLFKIKSYAKLFDKNEGLKTYKSLDFGQLVELSKIDMYLRRVFFDIILTIEHSLKVELINNISRDPYEDGYSILHRFFSKNTDCYDSIIRGTSSESYSSDIIKHNKASLSIWNYLELADFGAFIKLYKFYYREKLKKNQIFKDDIAQKNKIIDYLWSIKNIRNACAHNNCLLVSLNRKPVMRNNNFNKYINYGYISDLCKIETFSEGEKNSLKSFLLKDLSITLLVFYEVVKSKNLRKYHIEEVKNLFDNRFSKNKNLFKKNRDDQKKIIESYFVMKKIIDKFDSLL